MVSGVTYDPEASCPRWNTFISEVMCSDQELASYLQRALGYALTGDTALECLFILFDNNESLWASFVLARLWATAKGACFDT